MMQPAFYTPKFSRALWSLAASGFYARYLDADDHAFLEAVRVRGIANGSLPNTSAVLIEELEFWHLPYAIDHGVARKAGPYQRPPETPEQRERRQASAARWHARRAIRKQEREIAAEELKREEREWAAAKERRKMREKISDAEWLAAAPGRRRKFGKVVDRHYVPQWKLDEQRLRTAERQKPREALATRKRKKREKIMAEARATLDRVNRLEREWQQQQAGYPTSEMLVALKHAIKNLLRSAPVVVWTPEMLMRGTGCTDRAVMDHCLQEMLRDHHVRKVPA